MKTVHEEQKQFKCSYCEMSFTRSKHIKKCFMFGALYMYIMAIRVVKFSKLERFLPKNQHNQWKFLNFENWVNGEVSKIGHHFRK